MINHHLEVMDLLGAKASTMAYSGAVTMVGSGALVVFGLSVTQIEIAFISMIIGAIVGVCGLVANIVFKWLAHREYCRANLHKEAGESNKTSEVKHLEGS